MISAIKEPGQPFQAGYYIGFMHALPTILYYNLCPPFHPPPPPNVNIPDATLHVQLANFLILFGENFCEQQLVLGKLLNTVKWSTFCVSFIRLLTILDWL